MVERDDGCRTRTMLLCGGGLRGSSEPDQTKTRREHPTVHT
jgi:hypothetical protein